MIKHSMKAHFVRCFLGTIILVFGTLYVQVSAFGIVILFIGAGVLIYTHYLLFNSILK